jgi:hypothetical protein
VQEDLCQPAADANTIVVHFLLQQRDAAHEPLRIGVVSSWLCNSAIGRFVIPLISRLASQPGFHVTAIKVESSCHDDYTAALRSSVQRMLELPKGQV